MLLIHYETDDDVDEEGKAGENVTIDKKLSS